MYVVFLYHFLLPVKCHDIMYIHFSIIQKQTFSRATSWLRDVCLDNSLEKFQSNLLDQYRNNTELQTSKFCYL